MLKKYIPVIFAFGVTVLLIASCAKEGPNGPTGPAGPSFTGSISGHVGLYDQYGSEILINLAYARILLTSLSSGDPYIPDTAIYSDANGLYAYNSIVTTGSYSISVTDSGYGSTAINSFQFISGTLNKDIKLSAIPVFSIDTLIATEDSAAAYDSLVIGVPADTRVRNCIVFVNSSSTVANTIGSYLLAYVKAIPPNTTSVNLLIPAQDLYNAGIKTGSAVYYAAYSYVVNDASVYEDYTSGRKVYNAVGVTPKTASAIAP
jgi:hypothetical protein